jgi:hypothetical protein
MRTAPSSWWLAVGESVAIFALFALQGASPPPDVNEPYYLGKAAHYWNPDWGKGDFFLESADAHQSFYYSCGWLTRWMPLPAVAWTGRLITWALLAWAWRRLSWILVPRPGWAILTAALFAMLSERCPMAGEWVIGGFEAKGLAYVFVFLGLEALLRGYWNRAWLAFGGAAMFHALVGGWAALAAAVVWWMNRKEESSLFCPLRKMTPGLLGGFLLALPGLIPALLLNWNVDAETLRQANVIYVFERLPHHLDLLQMKPEFIRRFVLLSVLFFLICWRIEKRAEGQGKKAECHPEGTRRKAEYSRSETSEHENDAINCPLPTAHCPPPIHPSQLAPHPSSLTPVLFPSCHRLKLFVQAVFCLMFFGVLINYASLLSQPLTAGLLRFYWYRLADVVVPLGVALTAGAWLVLSGKQILGKIGLTVSLLLLGLHFGNLICLRFQPETPPADRLPDPNAWYAACNWVQENTPPHDRFLTPRLSQTFKWYTARAEVVTWKEVPQDARAIVQWWRRLEDIYATGRTAPESHWHDNLSAVGSPRLEQLGGKYKARYAIIQKTPLVSVPPSPIDSAAPNNVSFTPLKLPVVYENRGYVIYRLSE